MPPSTANPSPGFGARGMVLARCRAMATFGHLAAGLATSRVVGLLDRSEPPSRLEILGLSLAAELPDLDFLLPVRHRGRTHSLAMGVTAGLLVAAVTRVRNPRRAAPLGVATTLAVWSHVLLDLGTAESGAASLWPIVRRRLSAPATPLPATPIGAELLTPTGMRRAAGEVAWATPLAMIGLWPLLRPDRRRRVSRR